MTDFSAASSPAPGARGSQRTDFGRLHRPRRWLVVLLEVVLVCAAVWGAFHFWDQGVSDVVSDTGGGTELVSTRYQGNWIGAAIALGGLASLLALDAVRQAMLALRVRRSRRRNPERAAWPEQDADAAEA